MNQQNNGHEPLDPWHYFEVVDRTGVVAELFDFSVAAHPVVEADGELSELAGQLGELLDAFYERAAALLEEKLNDLGE